MHEENGMAEQCWRSLAIIKDSMLILNVLPVEFWMEAIDIINYFHNRLPTKRDSLTIIPEKT